MYLIYTKTLMLYKKKFSTTELYNNYKKVGRNKNVLHCVIHGTSYTKH